ncbi:MAG: hypothetical protein AAB638_04295 [Patescibacteria group bacterium]
MVNQKQLLILIIVASSLTSFLGGYLLTQKPSQSSAILSQQRGALIDRFDGVTGNSTPTPLPPGLLRASSDISLSPINSREDNTVLYYHPDNGFVSKIDLETRRSTLISTTQLSGTADVIWSPNRNRVITLSRNSNGITYKYFDYTTREHGTLSSNTKSVAFSPDSGSLVSVKSQNNETLIQTSDFNGRNPKTILKTRLDNIEVAWPNIDTISFTANDANESSRSLYTLSAVGDLSQLLSGEDDLDVKWSPDGSKFIYSSQTTGGVALRIFVVASKESWTLEPQTSSNNCAWPSIQSSIVCAVQQEGETSIIQIPLSSRVPKILFSNLIITPKEAFLSQLENFLVIINAQDQSIWAVKLLAN